MQWAGRGGTRHPFQFEQQEAHARDLEHEKARLTRAAVRQERNVREWRHGWNPKKPEVESLMDKGGDLEDMGDIVGAVRLYERALVEEPMHLILRQYIDTLNTRINAAAAEAKHRERQKQLSVKLAGEAHIGGLRLRAEQREPPFRRGRIHKGYDVPPAPKDYGQQLLDQAAENRQLRDAARRREAELDRREVASARQAHSVDQYKGRVSGNNDAMAWKNEMRQALEDNRAERMRKYMLEQQYDPTHAPQGPLLGMGELHGAREAEQLRRRNRDWHIEQERLRLASLQPWGEFSGKADADSREWGAQVRNQPSGRTPSRGRPYSAGPIYKTTSHYPNPPQSPPVNLQQAQQKAREARYGGVRDPGIAPPQHSPFARPGVDNPMPSISPADVRRRQEVFYQKHAKPNGPVRPGAVAVSPGNHVRIYDHAGAIAGQYHMERRAPR